MLVNEYFERAVRLLQCVDLLVVNAAIDLLYDAWSEGRTVFTMGNGGSASTATHLACDLAKWTIAGNEGKPRIRAMSLVDNIPLASAWTNDDGFDRVFVEQLRPWLGEGDVLIAISVHGGRGGWSSNLIGAMQLAKARGAKIVGLAGFDGGLVKEMADVCIVVPIDEEPLATPLIESIHVLIGHCLAEGLRRRMEGQG